MQYIDLTMAKEHSWAWNKTSTNISFLNLKLTIAERVHCFACCKQRSYNRTWKKYHSAVTHYYVLQSFNCFIVFLPFVLMCFRGAGAFGAGGTFGAGWIFGVGGAFSLLIFIFLLGVSWSSSSDENVFFLRAKSGN